MSAPTPRSAGAVTQRLSSRSRLAIIGPISSGTPHPSQRRHGGKLRVYLCVVSRHQPTAKIGGDGARGDGIDGDAALPSPRGPCTRSASPQPLLAAA
ncbi:hypothetical protein LNQ52_27025 [Klebsiella pneumoniae subsp. pneumoniae]|nr:hypothetical protein [Klebsiella pneumoniae subsp. pneumoniae]